MALTLKLVLVVCALTGQTCAWDPLKSLKFGQDRGSPSEEVKSGACSEQLLELLGDTDFDNFTACVGGRLNLSDPGPGSGSSGAYADCWCAGNVSSFIRAQGCEDHPNWGWLSKVDCADECDSPSAQECARTCPAECFESNSKGGRCRCTETCVDHLLCIAQAPENATLEDPAGRCSGEALAHTTALREFQTCVSEETAPPSRGGTWDLLARQFQCLCAGSLQEELISNGCCDAANNHTEEFIQTGLCTADCSLDCASTAARECLSMCGQLCEEGTPGDVSQECADTCVHPDGRCHQYKVCTATAPSRSYFCDDGSAPNPRSGCCQGVFVAAARCPLLCEFRSKRTFWRPSSVGGTWKPTSQCDCGGCPATKEETFRLMNETLLAAYKQAAGRQLMYIAVMRSLEVLSPKMRSLFSRQIQAARTAIAMRGGALDRQLVERLHAISVHYFTQLQIAADEQVISREQNFFARPRFGLVWLVLISSLIVILTIAMGCLLPQSLRRCGNESSQGVVEAVEPPARMVVGRPISSKEQPPTVVEGVMIHQVRPGSAAV